MIALPVRPVRHSRSDGHSSGAVGLAAAMIALCAMPLASGCGLVDAPEPIPLIEEFRVDMTLKSNTCGYAGLMLDASRQLDGTLRGYAGDSATWLWEDQTVPASGSSTTSGRYTFVDVSSYEQIAADPTLEYPGCIVVVRTEMSFAVLPVPVAPVDAGASDGGASADAGADADADAAADAGADAGVPYALDGEMRIDVSPASGSDCTPLLGANGGTWNAVPCQALLDLSGVPVP